MIKVNKIIKSISSILVGVASLVMVVLSIINIATGSKGTSETLAFRIIICVMLIVGSLLSTGIVISKDPKHFDVKLIMFNGILLGTGIFAVLDAAGGVADIIVGWFVPCIIIGLGGFLILASIISAVNKINRTSTNVISTCIGALMLTAGIIFLVYAKDLVTYMWLIIGIILLISSIFSLIEIFGKKKDKKELENIA